MKWDTEDHSWTFAAILYYDFAITVSTQIIRYWKGWKSLRGASSVFLLTRHTTLVLAVPVIYELYWTMPEQVSLTPIFVSSSKILTAAISTIDRCV